MNRSAAFAVALVLGLAPAAARAAVPVTTTSTSPTEESATATVSSTTAAARPVVLTLALHYEMQCGQPGKGPLVVGLPAAMRLPAQFASGSARLNGTVATPTRSGTSSVVVDLPPPPQVLCDVIGPGTLKLVLTRAAGIANPAKAGTYTVTARVGTHSFRAAFRVGAA